MLEKNYRRNQFASVYTSEDVELLAGWTRRTNLDRRGHLQDPVAAVLRLQ